MKIRNKTLIRIAMIATMFLIIFSLQAVFADDEISATDFTGINNALSSLNPGETLVLNPGTYAKSSGDSEIVISKDVTIQGKGPKEGVIIDANKDGRIFQIDYVTVTFINITFINAKFEGKGGAIYNDGGNIILKDTVFKDNIAEDGGAIYSESGAIYIENSVFERNTALGSSEFEGMGGAIHLSSAYLTIENCNFINNTADYGGALIVNGAHVSI